MRSVGWLLLCFGCLSALTGCGSTSSPDNDIRGVGRTSGGALVLSYDERIAVATNRAAGVVTVLTLKPERGLPQMVTHTEVLDVGAGSEPYAAVIGADGDTAYVLLRKSQQVLRIDQLRSGPTLGKTVPVGSEPTSIAITPDGDSLWVANWGDGTVSRIDVALFAESAAVDVNESLVKTNTFGPGFKSRWGLAHPRALSITNKGDGDEILYATEFFSQPMPQSAKGVDDVDRNRQGFVYPIHVSSGQQEPPIPISPIKATGFVDGQSNMTACFPNQLYAAAVDDDRLYVTSVCASPRGPLDPPPPPTDGTAAPPNPNFKTLVQPVMFVVDTNMQEESPDEALVLTRQLQDAYDRDGNTTDVRMPLIPNELAFRPGPGGTRDAYVLALGADAVFHFHYAADGTLLDAGSKDRRYIGPLPKHGYAIGLAVSRRSDPAFALTLSDVAQQISIIDLSKDEVVQTEAPIATTTGNPRAEEVSASDANEGRGLFATGLGAWSFKGQAWSSCESCHPEGLSDGVTWYFSRGPRRTLSPANTYDKSSNGKPPGQRLLLWGANVDEVHDVEVIARSVSGGEGGIIWQYSADNAPSNACRIVYDYTKMLPTNPEGLCAEAKRSSALLNGLNGSLAVITDGIGCGPTDKACDHSINLGWNQIDAFVKSLRAPSPPSQLDATQVAAGKELFRMLQCNNCHAGPQLTVSTLFFKPGADENGQAPWTAPSDGSVPPLGKLRSDVYSVPTMWAGLNPVADKAARDGCPSGTACATLRAAPTDASTALDFLYGEKADATAKNDQLRCALRNVGTFPLNPDSSQPSGVAPNGQPKPLEVRADMSSLAQGADGFSVPSLLGLTVGAPYFHAGNARTLEEVFDPAFAQHHLAFASTVDLAANDNLANLVSYLLSLDGSNDNPAAPAELDFCRARQAR